MVSSCLIVAFVMLFVLDCVLLWCVCIGVCFPFCLLPLLRCLFGLVFVLLCVGLSFVLCVFVGGFFFFACCLQCLFFVWVRCSCGVLRCIASFVLPCCGVGLLSCVVFD